MRKIYTDGHIDFSGKSGYSKIVIDGKDLVIPYLKTHSQLTNSEAELIAIIHAIHFAKDGDVIYSDSQYSVYSIIKNWKQKEARLENLVVVAKTLLQMKRAKLEWIEREKNLAT